MSNGKDSPINIIGDPKTQQCLIAFAAPCHAVMLTPLEAARAAAHLLNAALRSCHPNDMETVRDAHMHTLMATLHPPGAKLN